MNRRHVPIAVVIAAAVPLFLTACGGGVSDSKDNDKIARADTGVTKVSASPSESASGSAERPDMALPGDIAETFEGWKTGDATKVAILADAGRAQTAVTHAVVKGDPEDPALLFYQAGTALSGSQDWVKSIVDSGFTFTGEVRYYSPEISVSGKDLAGLAFCSDESKAFNKNRKTSKIDTTPVSDDSYVLYSTRLEKNEQGVWQTTKLESERGNETCTP